MRIMFVCTGNICRSPMAEIYFRELCKRSGNKDVVVDSAGTFAPPFMSMTGAAIEALRECAGIQVKKPRKNKQFKRQMIQEFDHIIGMTEDHVRRIGDFKNVYTLGRATGCGEVPDPWGNSQEVYTQVFNQIKDALDILYTKLMDKEKEKGA